MGAMRTVPEAAVTLVDTLCWHSRQVVFSAATPGQGGHDHRNERPLSYWKHLFMGVCGYTMKDLIRPVIQGTQVASWYKANIVCFTAAG